MTTDRRRETGDPEQGRVSVVHRPLGPPFTLYMADENLQRLEREVEHAIDEAMRGIRVWDNQSAAELYGAVNNVTSDAKRKVIELIRSRWTAADH